MFTANLWCQKQLLCQLKHNHCPKVIKYFENDNFSYKSIKIIGQIDGPLWKGSIFKLPLILALLGYFWTSLDVFVPTSGHRMELMWPEFLTFCDQTIPNWWPQTSLFFEIRGSTNIYFWYVQNFCRSLRTDGREATPIKRLSSRRAPKVSCPSKFLSRVNLTLKYNSCKSTF